MTSIIKNLYRIAMESKRTERQLLTCQRMVEIKLMSVIISFILGANIGFLLTCIIVSGKDKE